MTRRELRKSALWALLIIGGLWITTTLAGCNTVEGMGEDVEDIGEGISGAAEGAGGD